MISNIFVDQAVKDAPVVSAILERLESSRVEVVDDKQAVVEFLQQAEDPIGLGKMTLFLTENKGPFVRKCPGTKSYTCCGYQILHIGTYCTMDCAYCILQAYFDPPFLQFFVNQRGLFDEVDALLRSDPVPFHRIGTGEFTDSLIWEPWTALSRQLISRFAGQDRVVLELKTKTADVSPFEGLSHGRKTIMAWSVNPKGVVRTEERNTASMSARLKAAARCEGWGYPLAFHFDPLILYEGWESDYRQLIEDIFHAVSPENVVWISIGSFRFMPSLKPIIQRRFPRSKIVYGEFIKGLDGKMRYFKPLRVDLYKKIVGWIRAVAPETGIYFCMEDETVWEEVLGLVPERVGGLPHMLDEWAARCCGIEIGDEDRGLG